jgi:methyl-accepting chemotaxis protein
MFGKGEIMADENKQPTPTPNGSDRRTLRGMLIKPREQIKYSFMFMGGGMLILTLFIGVVIYSLNRTMLSLEAAYGLDAEISQVIRSAFTSTLTVALLLSAVLAGFAFLLGIQMSHRIYGPLVPLQRQIGEIKKGNYAARVKLRKHDELVELQDSLNDLAESLGAQHETASSKTSRL